MSHRSSCDVVRRGLRAVGRLMSLVSELCLFCCAEAQQVITHAATFAELSTLSHAELSSGVHFAKKVQSRHHRHQDKVGAVGVTLDKVWVGLKAAQMENALPRKRQAKLTALTYEPEVQVAVSGLLDGGVVAGFEDIVATRAVAMQVMLVPAGAPCVATQFQEVDGIDTCVAFAFRGGPSAPACRLSLWSADPAACTPSSRISQLGPFLGELIPSTVGHESMQPLLLKKRGSVLASHQTLDGCYLDCMCKPASFDPRHCCIIEPDTADDVLHGGTSGRLAGLSKFSGYDSVRQQPGSVGECESDRLRLIVLTASDS